MKRKINAHRPGISFYSYFVYPFLIFRDLFPYPSEPLHQLHSIIYASYTRIPLYLLDPEYYEIRYCSCLEASYSCHVHFCHCCGLGNKTVDDYPILIISEDRMELLKSYRE